MTLSVSLEISFTYQRTRRIKGIKIAIKWKLSSSCSFSLSSSSSSLVAFKKVLFWLPLAATILSRRWSSHTHQNDLLYFDISLVSGVCLCVYYFFGTNVNHQSISDSDCRDNWKDFFPIISISIFVSPFPLLWSLPLILVSIVWRLECKLTVSVDFDKINIIHIPNYWNRQVFFFGSFFCSGGKQRTLWVFGYKSGLSKHERKYVLPLWKAGISDWRIKMSR